MGQDQNFDILWERLQRSAFRSTFRLNEKDLTYLHNKGMAVVLAHARDFIAARLAPALPAKDGKQTPWRGHPVFVAQHGTATCCRGCLEKWHGIAKGQALSAAQQDYIVQVIALWLERRGGDSGGGRA
ncbi:DUF4186 domain-containing protein [Sodalis sp. RH14]|uniref:DUF4186 domain-containing protein n=1 Tax=Sodalis sp. RH14 TaxID=3394329 RepID=UPI0039B5D281